MEVRLKTSKGEEIEVSLELGAARKASQRVAGNSNFEASQLDKGNRAYKASQKQ